MRSHISQMEPVEIALWTAITITLVVWGAFEVRHKVRFEEKNGPMPQKIRNIFLCVGLFEMAALTLWQTQHGIIYWP